MHRDEKFRWRPSPWLQTSALLHLGAVAVSLARPQMWPWTLGAVVANQLQLAATGLWPRSTLLGSNWIKLPAAAAARGEVALTIDDGPEPAITPRVLEVLERYDARATFFCIGLRIEQHAELAREIVRRGHAIENHSYRHLNTFSLLGLRRLGEEIERAQHAISAISGEPPRFFRAPAGLRSPWLDPVLGRLQLQLTSWTRRGFDTVSHDAAVVLGRLTHTLGAGDILLLHDGHAARTIEGTPIILEVLPRLLDALAAARLKTVTLRAALP